MHNFVYMYGIISSLFLSIFLNLNVLIKKGILYISENWIPTYIFENQNKKQKLNENLTENATIYSNILSCIFTNI